MITWLDELFRQLDSVGDVSSVAQDRDGRHWLAIVGSAKIGGFKSEAEARAFLESPASKFLVIPPDKT